MWAAWWGYPEPNWFKSHQTAETLNSCKLLENGRKRCWWVDEWALPDSQDPNLLRVGVKGASRPEEQPRKESSCKRQFFWDILDSFLRDVFFDIFLTPTWERQPLYGCIARLSRPSSLSRSIPADALSQFCHQQQGERLAPPLDEVTIRLFPIWRPFGVEVELVGTATLARGEGGEFGSEVECLHYWENLSFWVQVQPRE